MTVRRMVIEADQSTAVAIEQADPGERCGTCGQAARVRVEVSRMDMMTPATLAYCRSFGG